MSIIDKLPEEVLITIFKFLDLKDQINASLVSTCFLNVLAVMWRRKYKYIKLDTNFPHGIRGIRVFLESVNDAVETMELNYMRDKSIPRNTDKKIQYEVFEIIAGYSYPNLKTLKFESCGKILFENVLKVAKNFKTLRSLLLTDQYISSVKNIKNLMYLESLAITWRIPIKFSQFQEILKELPLKSIELGNMKWGNWTSVRAFRNFCALEHIHVYSSYSIFPYKLSLFSNLKEFKIGCEDVYEREEIMKNVVRHKKNEIIGFRFKGSFYRDDVGLSHNFLSAVFLNSIFENLRKVCISEHKFSNITDILLYAPNLNEIWLCNCFGLKEQHVLAFLNSPQMEIISIIYCKYEFPELSFSVDDVVSNRTKLLHFNFYENYLTELEFRSKNYVRLNAVGSSLLLKVTENLSTDFLNDIYITYSFFNIFYVFGAC